MTVGRLLAQDGIPSEADLLVERRSVNNPSSEDFGQFSERLYDGVSQLVETGESLVIDSILPIEPLKGILAELESARYWMEERWVFTPSDDVELAELAPFESMNESRRFSHSDSLREVYRPCYPHVAKLEGFLRSPDLLNRLGKLWRSEIVQTSVDIARYRKNHFLSEHADVFGGRQFAAVLFVTAGWSIQGRGVSPPLSRARELQLLPHVQEARCLANQ